MADPGDRGGGLMARLKSINWTQGKQIFVLVLVFIVYLLIGAAVFMRVEGSNADKQKKELAALLANFSQSHSLNASDLRRFTVAYQRIAALGGAAQVDNWAYAPSLFFCLTIVTTIGYGNITPVTAGGQAFACIFALIGIPLTGVLLLKIGSSMSSFFDSKAKQILLRCNNRIINASTVPIIVAAIGIFIFLVIPAAIFHRIEDWTFAESMYYTFVTLSTIGFGDYVPGQSSSEARSIYKILACVWIIVGLAFLAWLLDVVNSLLKKGAKRVQDEAMSITERFATDKESRSPSSELGVNSENEST